MANVSFYHGTKAKLDETPLQDGTLYACTDEQGLYLDMEGQRYSLSGSADPSWDNISDKPRLCTAIEEKSKKFLNESEEDEWTLGVNTSLADTDAILTTDHIKRSDPEVSLEVFDDGQQLKVSTKAVERIAKKASSSESSAADISPLALFSLDSHSGAVIQSGEFVSPAAGWNSFKFPEPFSQPPYVTCQSDNWEVEVRNITSTGFQYRTFKYSTSFGTTTNTFYAYTSTSTSGSPSSFTGLKSITKDEVPKNSYGFYDGFYTIWAVPGDSTATSATNDLLQKYTVAAGSKTIYASPSQSTSSKSTYSVLDGTNYENHTVLKTYSSTSSTSLVTVTVVTSEDMYKENSSPVKWLAVEYGG